MGLVIRRFDIFLVNLDPTQGHEIKKTRPCVIISPDEMNQYIGTVIITPLTTKGKGYPTRIPITFQGKKGHIVLDQMRALDKSRLIKKLGSIGKDTSQKVLEVLAEMFAP